MSLGTIIEEVCEKCGYDATDDRELLIKIINRACLEIYEFTDLPGSLREITVLASNDSIISLPSNVGALRAIRSHFSLERLTLQELASKYSFQPWAEQWNKWRLIQSGALKTCIVNSALPIYVSMGEIDTSDVVITVTGRTVNSARVSETVTIEAGETETQLSKEFIEIFSITKVSTNNNDVTFTGADADGNELELAVIANDQLFSSYLLVDVSLLPYGGDLGTGYRYVDVLYKSKLPYLQDDGDEFICAGFDMAIVCKVCSEFFGNKADGSQKAIEYEAKAQQLISQRINHTNGATEKMLTFAPDGKLSLYPPYWSPQAGGLYRGGFFP